MPEAIKYETTTIPARRPSGEIMELLAEYGARHVSLEYDSEGEPATVSFAIHDPKLGQLVTAEASTPEPARDLEACRQRAEERRRALLEEASKAPAAVAVGAAAEDDGEELPF